MRHFVATEETHDSNDLLMEQFSQPANPFALNAPLDNCLAQCDAQFSRNNQQAYFESTNSYLEQQAFSLSEPSSSSSASDVDLFTLHSQELTDADQQDISETINSIMNLSSDDLLTLLGKQLWGNPPQIFPNEGNAEMSLEIEDRGAFLRL